MAGVGVVDVTDVDFQSAVIEKSKEVPVVVDLWAPWCGPCRTLGPILENVIGATDGKVLLAKVNVDDNPAVAQAFQVQGIPAVYALKDGTVVDGFVGAQGESFVKDFVGKLLPGADPNEALLEAGDESSLAKVLESDPNHVEAIEKLAGIYVESQRDQQALDLAARVPETPILRTIKAQARLNMSGDSGNEDVEAKLDGLLPNVKDDEDARQQFLDLIESLGPESSVAADYRRKLASVLF